jgi:hypothetical protein
MTIMRPARSIDDVLEDAVIPDAFADYDLAASKQQIARDIANIMPDTCTCPAGSTRRIRTCGPPPQFPARHTRAGTDLRGLSDQVLHRADTPALLAQLANSRRIDPDGALQFGCLLHLAAFPDGAQFWWQFAAGGGNPTAAHCLHLLHLARGDIRDAEHWARQAVLLSDTPWAGRLSLSTTAVRDYTCHATAALRALVRCLTVEEDDDLGRVPRPDPCLAIRIAELA